MESKFCPAGENVYLASRYSRRGEMVEWKTKLEACGFVIMSRWINGTHEKNSDNKFHPADEIRFATEDIEDLKHADIFIYDGNPALFDSGRGGRHVEFGLAYALGKQIVIIGERENIFHQLPAVHIFPDVDNLLSRQRPIAAEPCSDPQPTVQPPTTPYPLPLTRKCPYDFDKPCGGKVVDCSWRPDCPVPKRNDWPEPNCQHLLTGDLDAKPRTVNGIYPVCEPVAKEAEGETIEQTFERGYMAGEGIGRIAGAEEMRGKCVEIVKTLLLDVARDGKQIAIVMCAIARISSLPVEK